MATECPHDPEVRHSLCGFVDEPGEPRLEVRDERHDELAAEHAPKLEGASALEHQRSALRLALFIDMTGEWSAKAFGSSENYLRVTTAARFYWSPVAKVTDLVLAARLVYSLSTSSVPFYSMGTLAMTDQDQEASPSSGRAPSSRAVSATD